MYFQRLEWFLVKYINRSLIALCCIVYTLFFYSFLFHFCATNFTPRSSVDLVEWNCRFAFSCFSLEFCFAGRCEWKPGGLECLKNFLTIRSDIFSKILIERFQEITRRDKSPKNRTWNFNDSIFQPSRSRTERNNYTVKSITVPMAMKNCR